MSALTSQIASLTIVYLTVYSRRRSKKTSKLPVTGLCAGNSPVTGEFPAQRPVTRKMFPFDDVIMLTWICWIRVDVTATRLCSHNSMCICNEPIKCSNWSFKPFHIVVSIELRFRNTCRPTAGYNNVNVRWLTSFHSNEKLVKECLDILRNFKFYIMLGSFMDQNMWDFNSTNCLSKYFKLITFDFFLSHNSHTQ